MQNLSSSIESEDDDDVLCIFKYVGEVIDSWIGCADLFVSNSSVDGLVAHASITKKCEKFWRRAVE